MPLKVTRTDVQSAEIKDQPGGLAACLDMLASAGANLSCVIARRKPEKPGAGIVFVTPLGSRKVRKVAGKAGFRGRPIAALKIEGNDRAGLGAAIARAIASARVNLRGVSAIVFGRKFIVIGSGFSSHP